MRSQAEGSGPRRLSAVPTQRASGPARSADDGGSGSGTRPPLKRRTRYTARAAVLLLVFCALVLALAYPLQQYFSQRSQLGKLKQQNSAKRAEVDQLRKELERWQDPDYVRIQARSRLHYVLPGETGLRLLGSGDAASGAQNPASTQGGGTAAWYSQLWGSVTSAAAAPATPPSPSQSPTSPTSPRSATTSTPSPTPATSPTPSTTPSSTKH